uniref:Ig-like domain-containing protein n=1 Tax=Amphiprion percula TaxID=161767 RepID=A0A3P8TKA0_AMPPE
MICFGLLQSGHHCVIWKIVIATVGTDVTLTCKYDAHYYGKLSVCWGRGAIPNRGCANEVIKSDGESVISRLSERYLLVGDLGEGDVSLTIRQVEESDSGMYGCRVDIPGWFNDHKHQLTLTVNAGESKLHVTAKYKITIRIKINIIDIFHMCSNVMTDNVCRIEYKVVKILKIKAANCTLVIQ